MRAWADLTTCRLRYLREALDDPEAGDCGRCDRCTGVAIDAQPDPGLVGAAAAHLQGGDVIIEPRRQWPTRLDEPKGRIAPEKQTKPGRALARLGDGGWHDLEVRVDPRTEVAVLRLDDEAIGAFPTAIAEAPRTLILGGGGFWPPFAMAMAGGVLLSTLVSFYFTPPMFALVRPRRAATRSAKPSHAEARGEHRNLFAAPLAS